MPSFAVDVLKVCFPLQQWRFDPWNASLSSGEQFP
jgi:hypothetical protein